MQTQETEDQSLAQEEQSTPMPPVSQPLTSLPGEEQEEASYPHLTPDEADAIFLTAVSEIPTQPLGHSISPQDQQAAQRSLLLVTLVLFLSMVGGAVLGIVTYPTVTIDLVPVSKRVSITAQLPRLPTRTLAPVSVTRTLSQPTTGHGHQDATHAVGSITFYNGRFSPQTITRGNVLTGSGGIEVVIDQSVTPAASTQQVGVAEVAAHALRAGSQGNVPALVVNLAVSGDLLAKNLTVFSGGKNARDYRAVSQADIATLTAHLHQQLTQRIPQAFAIASGEMVTPTHCTWRESVDHALGQEAAEVTETARSTCTGVAYETNQLQQSATSAFTAATRPGSNYELVGSVQTSVTAVLPVVTAGIGGLWVYRLSEGYEQFLAQQLAGDSQEQARAYLLATGLITRVTVPAGQLPKDPAHIHFETLIGV